MTGKHLGWVTTVALLGFVASCAIVPFIVPQRKTVSPEFDKLPNRRVAVLVFVDPSTLFDYPYARFELASFVGDKLYAEMAQRALNTDVVDPRDVEDFLQRNRDAEIDPQEVGLAFDADYVLFLEILTFQIRDPRQPQFLRGRISAAVSMHDIRCEPDELCRFELTPVTCVHPDGAPVILTATNSAFIREATYRAFAEQVARKFYEHTVDL